MLDTDKSGLKPLDDQAAAVAKTDNRVSLESLHERIRSIEYFYPTAAPQFTVAIVVLDNGFVISGESACADPKNFDKELGQKFAVESAVRKIWPLEGYLLREQLHKGLKT